MEPQINADDSGRNTIRRGAFYVADTEAAYQITVSVRDLLNDAVGSKNANQPSDLGHLLTEVWGSRGFQERFAKIAGAEAQQRKFFSIDGL